MIDFLKPCITNTEHSHLSVIKALSFTEGLTLRAGYLFNNQEEINRAVLNE